MKKERHTVNKQTLARVAHKKAVTLEALEKSLGVVTTACKSTGIPRRTVYEWIAADENFARRVAEFKEVALDFAESNLHKLIKAGSPAATIFFLKTQGRKRGYIERTEFSLGDQASFIIDPDQAGATKILKSLNEDNDKTD